jgi:polar amino acid transport system substrate-binding protein
MVLARYLAAAAVYSGAALLSFGASAQTSCPPRLASPPLVMAGMLMAATNPTAAPMQYVDETGKLVGLDIDFGALIAERLCVKIEWMRTEFAAMIPGLKGGRFDMIDTFMYYTPERAAAVHMIPYGAATLAIIVPQADATAITSLDYFSGKRFGTQLGSTDDKVARAGSDELVKAGKAAIDIRTFPNYSDLLQALTAGQLDGAFIGTEQAYFYRDKGQKFFRVAVTGLFPHAEALAFADKAVAEAVAEVLNKMKADGSFDKLFGAYHHCTLPPPFEIKTGPLAEPKCAPEKG